MNFRPIHQTLHLMSHLDTGGLNILCPNQTQIFLIHTPFLFHFSLIFFVFKSQATMTLSFASLSHTPGCPPFLFSLKAPRFTKSHGPHLQPAACTIPCTAASSQDLYYTEKIHGPVDTLIAVLDLSQFLAWSQCVSIKR